MTLIARLSATSVFNPVCLSLLKSGLYTCIDGGLISSFVNQESHGGGGDTRSHFSI